DIVYCVNIQHDCHFVCCDISGTKIICQEHKDTTQTQSIVAHKPSTNYVLNLVALHNYKELLSLLPPDFPPS
ncbi:hypothetical protein K439DRAFT_1303633, partial [Ramaria rubella]